VSFYYALMVVQSIITPINFKINIMNNNRKNKGFSLIEAMITIAVAGILLSIAIPSFSKMIETNRISSASNEFMAAMMLTRSEAVTRTIPVTICPSNTGTSCDASLNNYAKGWVVFSDCNSNGTLDAITNCDFDGNGTNDPDTVINISNGFKKLIINGSGNAQDRFSYNISGRPVVAPLPNFKIGIDASHIKKKMTIALTGRVKICKTTNDGSCE
jgi:type IV fimbrial biogenesis protein FimT